MKILWGLGSCGFPANTSTPRLINPHRLISKRFYPSNAQAGDILGQRLEGLGIRRTPKAAEAGCLGYVSNFPA
jgi:hypothetical protein